MLGFCIYKPKVQTNLYKRLQFHSVETVVKNKLFIFLFIICFCFTAILFYRQRMLLALYTLSDMRGDFMDMILEGSGGAYLFYNIIGVGMFNFVLSLLVYMVLFERKWKYIAILFIYASIWAIVSGGRAQVMNFGFYFLSTYIIADHIQSVKNGKESRYRFTPKAKVFISILFIIMLFSMSIVTFMKHSTGKIDKEAVTEGVADLGMDFGEYSAGPIVAFDIGRNDKGIMTKENQYGAATFSGTDYFLYIALRRFGIHKKPSHNITTHVLQDEIINIAPDRRWNYAYTSCMYYYYDFGVLGVIFYPLLFGFLVRKLISRLYESSNIYNIAVFGFVCFCMYMSVFSGYMHKMIVAFYIPVLFILSHLKSKKDRFGSVKLLRKHYNE